jgi:hypothetical protein
MPDDQADGGAEQPFLICHSLFAIRHLPFAIRYLPFAIPV